MTWSHQAFLVGSFLHFNFFAIPSCCTPNWRTGKNITNIGNSDYFGGSASLKRNLKVSCRLAPLESGKRSSRRFCQYLSVFNTQVIYGTKWIFLVDIMSYHIIWVLSVKKLYFLVQIVFGWYKCLLSG